MGRDVFSKVDYSETRRSLGIERDSSVTFHAEQEAQRTNKLRSTVDPAHDPVRRSLMRFDPNPGGGWVVTVGVPVPLESEVDTTGSMRNNVDIAMKNLPETYELAAEMLPGYDLQAALGIFGDTVDKFIFQRPQFEMTARAIVNYLKDMAPEGEGGDSAEDPQYGLFAAAYLTDAYINRIGLKGYHFCVSDAWSHEGFSMKDLKRVFGDDVLELANENIAKHYKQHEPLTPEKIRNLSICDVVEDLLTLSHAFFICVGRSQSYTAGYWQEIYGCERVITIPTTECLPQIQAAIIGLTEGTLAINEAEDWLTKNDVSTSTAQYLADQLTRIPLRAQETLRAKLAQPLPKVGDLFASKTDLWPRADDGSATKKNEGIEWL